MRNIIGLRIAVFLCLLLAAGWSAAQEMPLRAELVAADDGGYALSADFSVQLSDTLDSVLNKGVPLVFAVEFETTRPRWYWFNERIVGKKLEMRLDFHALTRSYRLSAGTQHQSFNTLSEALRALGTVRGWNVLSPGALEPLSTYNVGVRAYLDVTQLPKPWQVSALANSEWTVASGWQRWGISTGPQGRIVQ
jgi:hypothetical protein